MSLATRGAGLTQFSRTLGLRRSYLRAGDFLSMMKPRVMSLVVFTSLVGLLIAPGPLDLSRDFIAIFCIAAGAGAAAVLNMWYDADVDAVMTRTAKRSIPSGRVSRVEALIFGLVLASGAIGLLGFISNKIAATLLAFTIFFYVAIYTMWLKRRTPQNIVIGGAAGALPPVIGWVASTGHIGVEPLILFLIIFLWTPAHFWALSLNHADEYARAGIPMLPVVAGKAETKKQILIYSILLVLVSTMPWVLGFAGGTYATIAVVFNARMLLLAVRLRRSACDTEPQVASLHFRSFICLSCLLCCWLTRQLPIVGRNNLLSYLNKYVGLLKRDSFRLNLSRSVLLHPCAGGRGGYKPWQAWFRSGSAWCRDQQFVCNGPNPPLWSDNAHIVWASQVQHAVEDIDRHVDFSHPTFVYT